MKKFTQLIKEVEFPRGFAKKVADMHGGVTFPNTGEDPENFEEKAPKPKPPKGQGAGGVTMKEEDGSAIRSVVYGLMEEIDTAFDACLAEGLEDRLYALVEHLREVRDVLVNEESDPSAGTESIDEAFKAGSLKLHDGSHVEVSEADAHRLNKMFESSSSRKLMEKTMMKNSHEFKAIVEFAHSLHEEQLGEAAIQKDLDEKVPVVVAGVKGAKSRPFTKKFKNYAEYEKWGDHKDSGDYEVQHVYNEHVDADGDTVLVEITEASVKKLEGYVDRATTEHGMANFAKRQTEGQPGKEKEAEYWARKESNRKKGISTAIDKLDKKNVTEATVKDLEGYLDSPKNLGLGKAFPTKQPMVGSISWKFAKAKQMADYKVKPAVAEGAEWFDRRKINSTPEAEALRKKAETVKKVTDSEDDIQGIG